MPFKVRSQRYPKTSAANYLVGSATSAKSGDLQHKFSPTAWKTRLTLPYIRKHLMNMKDLDIPGAVGSHVAVIGICCNYHELISIPTAVVTW
jgi:hypothetical protein